MVLVDTSVWIDALNGKKNRQTELLEYLITHTGQVVICPTIIQEILQGIRNDADYRAVKEELGGFPVLDSDPVDAAYGAADIYRNARKKGITIRKSNDCLIAYYAIAHKAFLLHRDDDFNEIAKYTSLKTLQELSDI